MRKLLIAAGAILAFVLMVFVRLYPGALSGGGAHLVLQPKPGGHLSQAAMQSLIQRRADALGWPSSARVQAQGGRFAVDILRFSDMAYLQRRFGAAPSVAFRAVDETGADGESLPSLQSPYEHQLTVSLHVLLTARHLTQARADFNAHSGQPAVFLTFDADGAQALARATRQRVGKRIALVLDGTVIAAPLIMEPITGGNLVLDGHYTAQQAQELAERLDAAAGDWPFALVEARGS